MYPGYYPAYNQQQQQQQQGYHHNLPPHHGHHNQHGQHGGVGSLAHLIPSPESASDGHTPTSDHHAAGPSSRSISAAGGKRPASTGAGSGESRKKARHEEDMEDDDESVAEQAGPAKPKTTRGARACTVCRRLKMKCEGAENGPPCKRCSTGNHECIFEESNRGKRSTKKQEVLARSLRKMERTLDTVLRSIGNPGLAEGLSSRSPSPGGEAPASVSGRPSSSTHSPHLHLSTMRQAAQYSPSTQSPHAAPRLPHRESGRSTLADESPRSPKLHSLPDNTLNPLGLLAETSLAHRRAQAAHSPNDSANNGEIPKVGVASDLFFKPGPMTILPLRRLFIERQVQPEMLTFVDTEEVVALFKIYFDHMNPQAHMLDPEFHTPSLVCSRSPFLLTSICAIASKYYPNRPELHVRLTDLSRKLAFEVPAMGYKSVEIVQAYFLLTLWGCGPVERFEHDRTWLLLGLGIRMATDLNLHRRTAPSAQETADMKTRAREVRNRERTWMIAFCLDRSISAQMGKPYTIQEDAIIQSAPEWWKDPDANSGDVGLAGYVELQRINGRCLDILSSSQGGQALKAEMDYLIVIKTFETQIDAWIQHWAVQNQGSRPTPTFVPMMGRFYYNYALLVVNSFGLQNALERAPANISHFFQRCHTAATACATIVTQELGPLGWLKYQTDSHFVQCSYAVLSLLKLIRPEFQSFPEHEEKTLSLVQDVADLLERVATGPLHTPALYSAFLRALISAKVAPPSSPRPSHGNLANGGEPPASGGNLMHDAAGGGPHNLGGVGDPGQDGGAEGNTGSGLNGFAPYGGGYAFAGEMGPVADVSTFPPTMAPQVMPQAGQDMLSMDSILAAGFWDNVLVPGYSNPMEGLSGGFVYGAGGSGLITPRLGMSPVASGANTPALRGFTRPPHLDGDNHLDGHQLGGGYGLVQKATVEGV